MILILTILASRVHIVAQRANRYIMVFHITILYNIYLPGGGGHGREDGQQSIYWSDRHDVRSADASTCRRRSAESISRCRL